jgi:hypothetical protein
MEVSDKPSAVGGPVVPRNGERRGLSPREIRITGGYWADVKTLNREAIIAHCDEWMERIGWTSNFDRIAAGDGTHAGIEFVDSEVYKLLEAMAWQLGSAPDAAMESRYLQLVGRVAAAQDEDGYLDTSFGHAGQRARYTDFEWGHELYCFGHLIQAAVARLRTGHDDLLPNVARKLVAHLWREFGPNGRQAVCGHPEVEMALVEFGRATANDDAVELARLFVERRGHGLLSPVRFGAEYFQDDVPVRSAEVLRGHAVRAYYLASGAIDVAVETNDTDLLAAVERQIETTVSRRTYLTGGVGAHHLDEAFGADYELPPDRAYAETCAAVASVMANWRLLLTGATGADDRIERVLLNNVLASPRQDGRAFFYTNTLHQRTRGIQPDDHTVIERAETSLRAPWFTVSCCPTNIARTLASAELYFATATSDGIDLHQYGQYEIDTTVASQRVRIDVSGDYPFEGAVRITFATAVGDDFRLGLRVPDWAEVGTIVRRGAETAAPSGRTELFGPFAEGETIELRLPMDARIVHPHPRIDAIRGQIAVERGPLVLALESTELPPDLEVDDVEVDPEIGLRTEGDGAQLLLRSRSPKPQSPSWPYGSAEPAAPGRQFVARLYPYSRWGNRGPSSMRIWIPAAP